MLLEYQGQDQRATGDASKRNFKVVGDVGDENVIEYYHARRPDSIGVGEWVERNALLSCHHAVKCWP
jgi:hypothetical protein